MKREGKREKFLFNRDGLELKPRTWEIGGGILEILHKAKGLQMLLTLLMGELELKPTTQRCKELAFVCLRL